MADERESLLRIAEAVADGSPVDWNSESDSHESLRGPLRALRIVESVSAAHRSGDENEATLTDVSELPERWGPLSIVERLGHGGFGEVFRAHDSTLERDVALKLLHPRRQSEGFDERRFVDEARRLARVRHPNVLVVHGADKHDGRVGLWTDLVRGMTLEQCLDVQGSFGAEEATRIGFDLCRALAAVHANGLVHNDVKTANVMREEGGRIVLMDFSSVAEHADYQAGDAPVSGTPIFMAPELFRGGSPSVASDVYSLGVVLYRLVSRRFPVTASSVSELRDKHVSGEPSTPLRTARPDLPSGFVQVVERALDPVPARRFQGVAEMERALVASTGAAALDSDPRPTWWRSHPLLAIAAILVVIVGIALIVREIIPTGAGFRVNTSLYRTGDDADVRLALGAAVSPGDGLFLEIESSEEAHVYVLNEDRQGNVTLLFPLPETHLRNPLPPNVLHRLPGDMDGVSQDWEVTSAGGEETFLVIAAREKMVDLEKAIADVPRASSAGPIALDRDAVTRLRGIGGITPTRPLDDAGRSVLSGIADRFAEQSAGDSGIQVWQMRLDNPVGGS